MKYVIIGNSAAAIGAVEAIRKIDTTGEITLISDEPHHTYSRPLISYRLSGKVEEKNMFYRAKTFYKDNNVTAKLGIKAVSVDSSRKTVTLENGEIESYDKLLVATGSSPAMPPIPGLKECKNGYTFLNYDAALKLMEITNAESRVVVLGAGLIGLKVAEGLEHITKNITIVDLADRLLPSVLDEDAAAMVQKHIEKTGIKFLLSDSAVDVKDNSLTLKSGKTLEFDILIIAVGVRPNISLVKDAGGEVNRGIITDHTQKTTLPDIYAAGDCVESDDISSNTRKILALLPNAYMQGETAGYNMAGKAVEFNNAMPINAVGFFGLPMVTAGTYTDDSVTIKSKSVYKRLCFKDNKLTGFIIINDIDRAGIYTSLIREKTDLSGIDMNLLKENPQLMMFSKSERKEKLGRRR